MTTINAVGNGLSGETGTGNFVGSTSPTLITPILGVASATSINFGENALNAYKSITTFTPAVTFATPGDLSVSYAQQYGGYYKIGGVYFVTLGLEFTPTFTTASGNFHITGLPAAPTYANMALTPNIVGGITFPAGATALAAQTQSSQTYLQIYAYGSAVAVSDVLQATNFTTTVTAFMFLTGFYF